MQSLIGVRDCPGAKLGGCFLCLQRENVSLLDPMGGVVLVGSC
jgi:hypothetical protein